MKDMYAMNATDIRKDWSSVLDTVVREKPQFIKRTHDYMFLTSLDLFTNLLSAYNFTATKFIEMDGSVTLSLNEIDLIENAPDEEQAKLLLAQSILDYAEEYYNEFKKYSNTPNRKAHVPYIMKAIIMNNTSEIKKLIICQAGEN